MVINIGKYKDFIGAYQIAEKLLFWKDKEKDDTVHDFGEYLSNTPLNTICQYIDPKRKRTVHIKIDKWDTWSMDVTLSHIIVPMLEQLKETKHGAPVIDNEDVPKELRIDVNDSDNPKFFEKWDYVLNEMISAFKDIQSESWMEQYHSGTIDFVFEELESNGSTESLTEMKVGPKDTHKFDKKGYDNHYKKIQNGLRLFGKYYFNLWS